MASSNSLLTFFTQMSNLGGVVVQDPVKFDIDLYIQNYKGRTRFDRLLFIGKTSTTLCVDALKAAVVEAKTGNDVGRYKEAWDCIRVAAPSEPEAQRDEEWIARTERQNKEERQRLEAQLKTYKNNLIKESIRMGYEDLGKLLESTGELSEAAERYSRMRQEVSTTKHIMDCGKHMIDISLQRRDWTAVINHVGKVTGIQPEAEKVNNTVYAKIVLGISLLGMQQYADAAKSFILDTTDPITSDMYDTIASPNDIANYGGLLALATMERHELQERVLDNPSFRSFLEVEPHIRRAITFFVNGRYSNCLAVLESCRNEYLLDIYLQKHIPAIFAQIRNKCIVQYFKPFSCVTIDSLNESFAATGESIEKEVVSMIRDGTLEAKIDSRNKLLVAFKPDPRLVMQKQALDIAGRYEREARERLRRMSVLTAGLEVAGNKLPVMRDEWFEEGIIPKAGGAFIEE